MGGRICLICFRHTYGNHPFCSEHYHEFKDEIDAAISNKEKWLQFLETDTARERRKINRERELFEYDREKYD